LIGAGSEKDELPEPSSAGASADQSGQPSIMISAGDLSGDQHAARVITELKKEYPGLKVWGLGGPDLEKAGAELLFRSENLAGIGIFNLINKVPRALRLRATLLAELAQRRPSCILLVDFGGFNLNFAAAARKHCPDIQQVYFISPQVWGSRPWRANVIAQCVRKILVIFPFEQDIYRKRGMEAHFVGHPLADKFAGVDPVAAKAELCSKLQLDPEKPIVGIFPGSRGNEVRNFTPVLMQAASWLRQLRPDVQFVMSQANSKVGEMIYDSIIKMRALPLIGSTVKLVNREDNTLLMAASDILWTKSGTTTLEAAMLEKPMLVFYRGDWLSYVVFLMMKTVKYVAWPNLLAGKMLVPELIQLDCRAEQLVRYTRDWLDVPGARKDITDGLRAIKSFFEKGNFGANAAAELSKTLAEASSQQRVPIEQNTHR
jgi:lipid-A-disaccharide synthase